MYFFFYIALDVLIIKTYSGIRVVNNSRYTNGCIAIALFLIFQAKLIIAYVIEHVIDKI